MNALARKGDHFDVYRYAEFLRLTAVDDEGLAAAFDEYSKAARMGNQDARYAMALMRLDGIGTPADPAAAIDELRNLGEDGNTYAMSDLTHICSDGVYMSPDRSE